MNETKQLFLHDKRLRVLVAGCDEAGRGALAGPLVCAACIMPLEKKHIKLKPSSPNEDDAKYINDGKANVIDGKCLCGGKANAIDGKANAIDGEANVIDGKCLSDGEAIMIDGVNDSKLLSEKKRDELFNLIIDAAIDYSVSIVDTDTIDEINILRATKKGMSDCINRLKITPQLVLVDAVNGLEILPDYEPIIKGDAISYNIACASIIAKVTRDRIMCQLDSSYTGYGFKQHKGYGTKQHVEALKSLGASPIHRKLFIRNALNEQLKFDI